MDDDLIVLESMIACEEFVDKAKAVKAKVASKLKKRKELEIEEEDLTEEEYHRQMQHAIKLNPKKS